MEEKQLYSTNQACIGAFFGGPLAAIFLLKANFDSLGKKSESRCTLIWGGLLLIVLLGIIPFLPDHILNYIPIATAILVGLVVEQYQMKKEDIKLSEVYDFQSNLNVFCVIIICAALFIAMAFAAIFILNQTGAGDYLK